MMRVPHVLRAVTTLALIGAGVCAPGAGASGFDLFGVSWRQKQARFFVNPNFPQDPFVREEQIEAIRCAADTWRQQTRAEFEFIFGGTTSEATDRGNDTNAVFFSDRDGNEALAVTMVYNLVGSAEIHGFDMIFFGVTDGEENEWAVGGEPAADEADLRGIAVHEFGHALGLDHSTNRFATMFGSVRGSGLAFRALHSDDLAGVETLYGTRVDLPPSVALAGLAPSAGPELGGTALVVNGGNFTWGGDTRVVLGGTVIPSGEVRVESCSRIVIPAVPAAARAGFADLAVTNSLGTTVLPQAYEYQRPFLRGDVDRNGAVDLADAVTLLSHLFRDGGALPCRDAADADDNGVLSIGDAIVLLRYLFVGDTGPAAPFPAPGLDPTDDELGCT